MKLQMAFLGPLLKAKIYSFDEFFYFHLEEVGISTFLNISYENTFREESTDVFRFKL